MHSLLQQLENNEAVLMMYLADELPPQDRAEVEQMLATDAGLRAELARMGEAQASLDAAVARLDSAGPRLPNEGVAIRRVGRAVAQWHADRLAAVEPATAGRRFPWFGVVTGAAAACVLISGLIWWASDPRGGTPGQGPRLAGTMPVEPEQGNPGADPAATMPAFAEREPFLVPGEDEMAGTGEGIGEATGGGGGAGGGAVAWADRFDELERDLASLTSDDLSSTFFSEPEPDSDGF